MYNLRPLAIAWLAVAIGACCDAPSSRDDDQQARAAMDTWGIAHARVTTIDGKPNAVVIEIQLLDRVHAPELYASAFALARRPGVVTIDHRIDLSLPESEGFPRDMTSGDIDHTADGYDPSLSRITEQQYVVTIPLRSDEARAAVLAGGTVTIDPYRSEFTRGSLRGLAFRWYSRGAERFK